jgi:hypothetical protein
LADERAFVFYDWVAGYGAEPTLERPTDDACERRFVADSCPMPSTSVSPLPSKRAIWCRHGFEASKQPVDSALVPLDCIALFIGERYFLQHTDHAGL